MIPDTTPRRFGVNLPRGFVAGECSISGFGHACILDRMRLAIRAEGDATWHDCQVLFVDRGLFSIGGKPYDHYECRGPDTPGFLKLMDRLRRAVTALADLP